jgi:hypothetical protein
LTACARANRGSADTTVPAIKNFRRSNIAFSPCALVPQPF